MRRRILVSIRRKKAEEPSKRHIGLTAYSTLAYTIFTGLILVGVVLTIYQQKGFNKKQLELYELSIAPQVFVEFDSLSFGQEQNVFYHIKNVGNSPAVGVRAACQITPNKENPLNEELTGEIRGEVFPGISIFGKSRKIFKAEEILYLHFRVEYQDLLNQKYYYKRTWYLIFQPSEDTATIVRYKRGDEFGESGKLQH
jgi:hypothetical protein